MDGYIKIDEDISENLELDLNVTRCDVDKKNCEHFERLIFSSVCGKLGSAGMFGAGFVKGMSPPLTCPLKKVTLPHPSSKTRNNSQLFFREPINLTTVQSI